MSMNSRLFEQAQAILYQVCERWTPGPAAVEQRLRRAVPAESLEARMLLASLPPVSFDVTDNPAITGCPAIGDFNGDGRIDLAVFGSGSYDMDRGVRIGRSAGILLGTGDGAFGSGGAPVALPDSAQAVGNFAVGDFNGDGKSDLAVFNCGSYDRDRGLYVRSSVSILPGNGLGTFGARADYAVGISPRSLPLGSGGYGVISGSVTAGDFNGDGKSDLLVAIGGYCYYDDDDNMQVVGASVSILWGNGHGAFGRVSDFAVGDSPASMAVGDFNGDGKSDLAVIYYHDSTSIKILLGNGNGRFSPVSDCSVDGYQITSMAVGDFNGDGKSDLAVIYYHDSTSIKIFLGNGNGKFSPVGDCSVDGYPRSMAVEDFNGDGKSDLAVIGQDPSAAGERGTATILLGNGNGTLQAQGAYDLGYGSYSVGVGDFNKDGKSDLAVANGGAHDSGTFPDYGGHYYPSSLSILLNTSPLSHYDFSGQATIDPSKLHYRNQFTDKVGKSSKGVPGGAACGASALDMALQELGLNVGVSAIYDADTHDGRNNFDMWKARAWMKGSDFNRSYGRNIDSTPSDNNTWARVDDSLSAGKPVLLSTHLSVTNVWPPEGEGHDILLLGIGQDESIKEQLRHITTPYGTPYSGEYYVVADPAGNYLANPSVGVICGYTYRSGYCSAYGHYGSTAALAAQRNGENYGGFFAVYPAEFLQASARGKDGHLQTLTLESGPHLTVTAHSPVHVLVTDPLGRQTGYLPDGTFVQQIPNSACEVEVSDSDEDPEAPIADPMVDIRVDSPMDGKYQVQLTGTGDGPYTIDTVVVSAAGNLVSYREDTGAASPGYSSAYSIDVDSPSDPALTDNVVDARHPYTFTDATGDTVTVRLSGPGIANVLRVDDGNPADVEKIVLYGTTSKSSLTVTVKGPKTSAKTTSIGEIDLGSGQLCRLSALAVDLSGRGIVGDTGSYIRTITLRDLTSGADVILPGTAAKTSSTITARQVGDGSDLSFGLLVSLATFLGFGHGTITAPSIGTLTTKGIKGSAAGDFAGNLEIGSLRTALIAGSVTAGTWTITETLGTVDVGVDLVGASLLLGSSTSVGAELLKALSVGRAITGTSIYSTGGLGAISAQSMEGNALFAGVGGDAYPASHESLGTQTIRSIVVKGLSRSTVTAFSNTQIAAGKVMSLSVAYPSATDLSHVATGYLRLFSVKRLVGTRSVTTTVGPLSSPSAIPDNTGVQVDWM